MKKLILTVLLTCLAGSSYAQIQALQERTRGFVQRAERYSSESRYLPDEYIGSPYGNETFMQGTIYENNEPISSNYFLRYNAIEDEIEAKENLDDPDSEIQVLTKSPEIFVKINNDLLVFNNPSDNNPEYSGYFHVLVVGNHYNFYKKINKKYYPTKKARNSFEKDVLATYKDKPIYYIVNQDGSFYTVPDSKNKRIKMFGNKSGEINKFIKHSNLDITEESDFIKAFKYFDSFDDASL